ncbi:DUF4336 domain-containing protein [Myxococcota bacterium]|nr:DUF4336 domain-containing protein [Myxococcota bacterium]
MPSADKLTPITDGLWGYEYDLFMFGFVHITVRPVIAKLPDGGVWILSPGPMSEALAAEIEALGPVRHLVSPNLYHYLSLGDAARRWPEARVWAPEGLAKKRPDLPAHTLLSDEAREAWGGVFDLQLIAGNPHLNEWVFLHRPSRALIVTDLLFNLQRWEGFAATLAYWATGTGGRRLAQTTEWRFMVRDRAAAARSARALVAWEPEILIPSHGDILRADVVPELRRALAWMLAGEPG